MSTNIYKIVSMNFHIPLINYLFCVDILSSKLKKQKRPVVRQVFFLAPTGILRHGTGNGAISVADAWTQQTHHTDHHNCYKCEDDRILNKPLAPFF